MPRRKSPWGTRRHRGNAEEAHRFQRAFSAKTLRLCDSVVGVSVFIHNLSVLHRKGAKIAKVRKENQSATRTAPIFHRHPQGALRPLRLRGEVFRFMNAGPAPANASRSGIRCIPYRSRPAERSSMGIPGDWASRGSATVPDRSRHGRRRPCRPSRRRPAVCRRGCCR